MTALDHIDRTIVNALQDGFPISERPYAEAAARLGIEETELLTRLQRLLHDGALSRFGPMYHAEQLGGALTLAAMEVPTANFDRVAEIVNGFPEVAHNYLREHRFNLWFVLAADSRQSIAGALCLLSDLAAPEQACFPLHPLILMR